MIPLGRELRSLFRTLFLAALSGLASTSPTSLVAEGIEFLLGTKNDRAVSPYRGPLLPTLKGPELQVVNPVITDASWSEDEGGAITIGFEGMVFSRVAKEMGALEPTFFPGYLYLNGDYNSDAEIPVTPSEGSKITGQFRKLIKDLPVTEGINTIELVFADPITRHESSVLFSLAFEPPTGPGGKPVISDQNREDSGAGSGGESSIHDFLVLASIDPSEAGSGTTHESTGILLGESIDCEFTQLGDSKIGFARRPDAEEPLSLIFIPSRTSLSSREQRSLLRSLTNMSIGDELSERSEFLLGYSFGMFLNGADLITQEGDYIERAVSIDLEKGGLVFDRIESLELDGTESQPASILCMPGLDEAKLSETEPGSLFDILWHVASLYRSGDPLAEEVPLALLIPDYASIGIEVTPTPPASEILGSMAEPLEVLNELLADESALEHGIFIGYSIATAMQVSLPRPDSGDTPWRRPLMSDVLTHFVDHFVEPGELVAASATSAAVERVTSRTMEKPRMVENIPPGKEGEWKLTSWFYRDIVWSDPDTELAEDASKLLPDSIKPAWVSPLLLFAGVLVIFAGGIWLLVVQFMTHLGWGFGQLGANLASCLLFIPGLIVAIIFSCLHWKAAKNPVTLYVLGWFIALLSLLFIPSWTMTVDG